MLWSMVLAALLIGAGVFLYYKLISTKNQVEKAFACVDVVLKKRYELIPSLISSVQPYLQYEKSTLIELTKLRSKAISGELSNDQRVEVEDQISRTIGRITSLINNYPNLKTDQDFRQVQIELDETEEQILAARKFYNSAAKEYNNAVRMLPTNIFASLMRYRLKRLFEIN